MKYIRTNCGIYDIDDLYEIDNLNEKPYGVKSSGWVIYKESIVATSDKLTDLFDGYVIIKGKRHVYYNPDNWMTSHKLLKADIEDGIKKCYGIVWTDKGLNYVAEMNAEGQFKLL